MSGDVTPRFLVDYHNAGRHPSRFESRSYKSHRVPVDHEDWSRIRCKKRPHVEVSYHMKGRPEFGIRVIELSFSKSQRLQHYSHVLE